MRTWLLIKLYRAWLCGIVSEPEKATGAPGFRAWLSPVNLILAVTIAISARLGFNYSGLAVFALVLVALAAYPLLMIPRKDVAPAEVSKSVAGERDKVLSMLENGKITAKEAAEALNALDAKLEWAKAMQAPFLPVKRTLMTGAVLVLIGFFLPWLTINPHMEMSRDMASRQESIDEFWRAKSVDATEMFWEEEQFIPAGGSLQVVGGDVSYGLGWIFLLLSLGAAMLTLARRWDARGRVMTMIALGSGSLILLYLLTREPRWITIGLVVVSTGYLLQWAAILKIRIAAPVMLGAMGQHT
jgi:hypothetical protein